MQYFRGKGPNFVLRGTIKAGAVQPVDVQKFYPTYFQIPWNDISPTTVDLESHGLRVSMQFKNLTGNILAQAMSGKFPTPGCSVYVW